MATMNQYTNLYRAEYGELGMNIMNLYRVEYSVKYFKDCY